MDTKIQWHAREKNSTEPTCILPYTLSLNCLWQLRQHVSYNIWMDTCLYCIVLTMTREGKKCLFTFRMDTTSCPHVFQFTVGRIMDVAPTDTGSAVTFERLKAKRPSRKWLVQGHTGSKCPGFASLLRFQTCLFFNSASYPLRDVPFLHT